MRERKKKKKEEGKRGRKKRKEKKKEKKKEEEEVDNEVYHEANGENDFHNDVLAVSQKEVHEDNENENKSGAVNDTANKHVDEVIRTISRSSARECFKKAAEVDQINAMYNYALMLQNGKGGPQN